MSKRESSESQVYYATVYIWGDYLDTHQVKGEKQVEGAIYLFKKSKLDHVSCSLKVSLSSLTAKAE